MRSILSLIGSAPCTLFLVLTLSACSRPGAVHDARKAEACDAKVVEGRLLAIREYEEKRDLASGQTKNAPSRENFATLLKSERVYLDQAEATLAALKLCPEADRSALARLDEHAQASRASITYLEESLVSPQ